MGSISRIKRAAMAAQLAVIYFKGGRSAAMRWLSEAAQSARGRARFSRG